MLLTTPHIPITSIILHRCTVLKLKQHFICLQTNTTGTEEYLFIYLPVRLIHGKNGNGQKGQLKKEQLKKTATGKWATGNLATRKFGNEN